MKSKLSMTSQADQINHREEPVHRSMFWVAYLANFLLMVAISSTFRFAEFVDFLNGTEQDTGKIVSAGVFAALIARFVFAQAIDHYGVRRVWLSGSVTFVVSCGLFLLCKELSPLIYGARICFVVGAASLFTCSIIHVQNQIPEHRRTEVIGNLGSSGFLGMIGGSQLGDLLFHLLPEGRPQFIAMFSGAMFLGAIYLFLVSCITRNDQHRQPHSTPPAHRLLFRYWLGNAIPVAMIMGAGFTVVTVFLTRYATERGWESSLGLFLTGYALSAFTFRISMRNWCYTIGRHRMILLGLLGHASGHAMLPWMQNEWQFLIPSIVCGFGHAFLFPAVVSLGSGRFPLKYRGTGTTLVLGCIDLGGVVFAPLFGWVIESGEGTIGFTQMFYMSTGCALTVAVFYFFTTARKPDVDYESDEKNIQKPSVKTMPEELPEKCGA